MGQGCGFVGIGRGSRLLKLKKLFAGAGDETVVRDSHNIGAAPGLEANRHSARGRVGRAIGNRAIRARHPKNAQLWVCFPPLKWAAQ